jgi:hypothetical protein
MSIPSDPGGAIRGTLAWEVNMTRPGSLFLILPVAVLVSPVLPAGAQQPGDEQVLLPFPASSVVPGESTSPVSEERQPESRFEDAIETDRDSFTPAKTTAGLNRFILETSYSFLENRGVKDTNSFPEMLLRYGLTERFELRLGWNYEVGGAGDDTSSIDVQELPAENKLERASNINYGLKFRVTDQNGWVPASAVILTGATPTSGMTTGTQFFGTYVFGWDLPYRCKLDAAMRYGLASENDERFNDWAPSVVLKVPVGERLSVHAEYFGIFSTGKAEEFSHQYASPGIHYLITPNLEVGVRVGWGLTEQTPRFFSNTGLGWRF